ncbi:unnamed protein product, partial [Nesidiocoris tenuis]
MALIPPEPVINKVRLRDVKYFETGAFFLASRRGSMRSQNTHELLISVEGRVPFIFVKRVYDISSTLSTTRMRDLSFISPLNQNRPRPSR